MGNTQVVTQTKCVILPPEREGESCVIRHPDSKDGLIERYDDDIRTLYEVFGNASQKYAEKHCLGFRVGEGPYEWLSYLEVRSRSLAFGSGLAGMGLQPHEDKIGIFSVNRIEWAFTEQACNAYSFILVPLYETLGPDAVVFIINQAELATVVCSGDKVEKLLEQCKHTPTLRRIVSMDPYKESQEQEAASFGITLITFTLVEKSGHDTPVKVSPPQPEEISTICYTSGTTGEPKGVILTHANFIAQLTGGFKSGIIVNPSDVHISYLPLAHVFERVVLNAIWYHGASAGFFRGDVRLLFDDIVELKPTIFASVPRLWNRLYDKISAAVKESGTLKVTAFEAAFEAKREGLKEGYLTHSVWDPIVFSSIREKLGGKVRLMITGSAPISSSVMEFLRICFSCPVVEGYGQTETCGAATSTPLLEPLLGTVGIPTVSVEVKLVDLPELGYTSKDLPYPRGEICFRGYSVTQGYYKNPEKTRDTIDSQGWLHSGDVGQVTEEGYFKVVDRAKNIFKLSHGEYIAPEKLENVFVQSKYVLQAFVYGQPIKSSLIAIVVPDPDVLLAWAAQNNKSSDLTVLCVDPEINKLVLEDMNTVGKVNKLRGFEFLKAIHLEPRPFTIENDLLTPTFKIKRPQVTKAFGAELSELYKDLD
eukprot:TRINITY_DN2567_c0_g1_i3.p1 TRINITY_DN2567_c0_g1~~TRINITY_DN2567_c0_g1_i3.p1  ORF type:complete len:649 (+),score=133.27 TRINITY_DN2567_c0_g1_i3:84-2030(+)